MSVWVRARSHTERISFRFLLIQPVVHTHRSPIVCETVTARTISPESNRERIHARCLAQKSNIIQSYAWQVQTMLLAELSGEMTSKHTHMRKHTQFNRKRGARTYDNCAQNGTGGALVCAVCAAKKSTAKYAHVMYIFRVGGKKVECE